MTKLREEWTNERDALLVRLRLEGKLKRGEIAEEINRQTGSRFTRSAICGRIDRKFLAANSKLTPEERATIKRARQDRHNAARREATRQQRIAAGLPPVFVRPKKTKPASTPRVVFRAEEVTAANVHGIQALEGWHCRFPLNDDTAEMIFCGSHVVEGKSWCYRHCAIVFQAPADSVRRAAA